MIAKYAGTCAICGKPFPVGESISWSRQEAGKAYHVACKVSASIPPVVREVRSTAPLTAEEKLLATMKALLASMPDDKPAETVSAPAPATLKASKPAKAIKLDGNSAWFEILEAVLPHVTRVLLVGPPGTGKSTTAMVLANTQHRITMTETTSREDCVGMFHLVDGETKYVYGPFATAMQNGDAVLTDEIDRYSPECASGLYGWIDDNPHISLPNGELLEAKDGYRVVMTTNESIETLPVAVQDRIEVLLYAGTPHPAALEGMPESFKQVTMRYYKSQPVPTIKLNPTVRRMRTFHKLLNAGIPNQIAANLVFGNGGAPEVLSAITSAESTLAATAGAK